MKKKKDKVQIIKNNFKNFFKNKYNIILIITILINLFIITYYSKTLDDRLSGDELLYINKMFLICDDSKEIFSKAAFFAHPPLIPALTAILNIILPPFISIRVIGIVFGILGIIVIYLLGKKLKNPFVGIFSAIILSSIAFYWSYSYAFLLDIPLTFFFLLTAFFLLKAKKYILPLIFSVILALLTKRTSIVIILFILLYLFHERYKNIKIMRIVAAMLFLLILSFILSLFYFRSLLKLDYFIILFFTLSLFTLLFYKFNKSYFLIFSWLFSVISLRIIFSDIFIPRYFLPILPAVILLFGIEVDRLYSYFKIKINKNYLILFIFLFVIILFLTTSKINSAYFNYEYRGNKDFAKWVENSNVEGTIYSWILNQNILRLYNVDSKNITFKKFAIKNQTRFINKINDEKNDTFFALEIYSLNPISFFLPLSLDKSKFLKSLNLYPIYTIYENVSISFFNTHFNKDSESFFKDLNITLYKRYKNKIEIPAIVIFKKK